MATLKLDNKNFTVIIFLLLTVSCTYSGQDNDMGKSESKKFNNLIDSLNTADTLTINYETQGCEHYFKETIKIYKRADSLFADLNKIIPNRPETFPTLTNIISDSAIISYGQFEEQGQKLKTSGLCTTQSKYIISIKKNRIEFEDGDCSFNCYYELKDKLFGKTTIKEF